MKMLGLVFSVVAGLSALAGEPVISSFACVREPGCCRAKVSYVLSGADAIVTASVCTNTATGACLEAARTAHFAGEVNRLVKADGAVTREIFWNAAEDFADDLTKIPTDFTVVLKVWTLANPPDYMVVPLASDLPTTPSFYPSAEALPDGGLANDKYRKTHLVMRRIPAAGQTFRMGSATTLENRGADEDLHLVTLTNDYYLAVYPLTSEQYKGWKGVYCCSNTQMADFEMFPCNGLSYDALRGAAPSVNWPDTLHAVADGSLLATFRTLSGLAYLDLPTEAEWEFACRAGTPTGLYNYALNRNTDSGKKDIGAIAWIYSNSGYAAGEYPGRGNNHFMHPVGLKTPNAYGLYDMCGNAYEWCLDWYGAYPTATVTGPLGPASGTARVQRGGSYCAGDFACTSSSRASCDPSKASVGGAGQYNDCNAVRLSCPIPLVFK